MHSLDHNNVLKFLEWYETPKHIWVVTELATGGSLADVIEQDGHIPLPHWSDFITDIANGLHYLHSRNILYCDLQPRKASSYPFLRDSYFFIQCPSRSIIYAIILQSLRDYLILVDATITCSVFTCILMCVCNHLFADSIG